MIYDILDKPNTLKELHLTDEKDIVNFFQNKFNELKYKYGGDNE